MDGLGSGSPARTVAIGSFVLLFIATGLAFGVTEAGHVALLQSDSITAGVVETTYSDGSPPSVTIGFRFSNPTPRPVTVTAPQELTLRVSGETAVRSTTPDIDPLPVRIPADGTAGATATIDLEAPLPDLRSAIRNGTVTVNGVFSGRIGTEVIQITTDGAADG